MKRYKFKLHMERELFSDGESAEEARQNIIENFANEEGNIFITDASDYLDDGVEELSNEDTCYCHGMRFENCPCFITENGCLCKGCGGDKNCRLEKVELSSQ